MAIKLISSNESLNRAQSALLFKSVVSRPINTNFTNGINSYLRVTLHNLGGLASAW